MIAWAARYFAAISPAFIDGSLYWLIAICSAIAASLNSDEAAKFIDPAWLFYLRSFSGWSVQGFLAIKLFRSTQYADHKQEEKKKDDENTQFLRRSEISTTESKTV